MANYIVDVMATAILWPVIPKPRDQAAEAQELRGLREELGFTRERIAAQLETSVSSFYRWETGKDKCPVAVLELMRCWAERERQKTKPTKKK